MIISLLFLYGSVIGLHFNYYNSIFLAHYSLQPSTDCEIEMKKYAVFLVFLCLNVTCLWISNVLMGDGPRSTWYLSLARAPWTPPGWAFGVVWSLIMLCYAIYMAILPRKRPYDYVYYLLILVLCAVWNYAFFNQQQVATGLIILSGLTIAVFYLTWQNVSRQRGGSWLMLPFCVWTLIATSLNAYTLF